MPDLTYLEARETAERAVTDLHRAGELPGGFVADPSRFTIVRRGGDWFAVAKAELHLGTVHDASTTPRGVDR